ncbi:hypothetical protein BESB_085100 [Besnoitia besnoiti]|uniref:Glycosyltransferase 2-like domain-containing protein n=1 Tax=Besnoitia besnoiti TaxID=94643 RepID=A0A2A9MAG8_BESBE|nr:hypothetical protein BESB_085100 [Besnoitia besnoiti]PFH33311.1 hypothetical protein BESB_085100 [Besnoitia besnoiti]
MPHDAGPEDAESAQLTCVKAKNILADPLSGVPNFASAISFSSSAPSSSLLSPRLPSSSRESRSLLVLVFSKDRAPQLFLCLHSFFSSLGFFDAAPVPPQSARASPHQSLSSPSPCPPRECASPSASSESPARRFGSSPASADTPIQVSVRVIYRASSPQFEASYRLVGTLLQELLTSTSQDRDLSFSFNRRELSISPQDWRREVPTPVPFSPSVSSSSAPSPPSRPPSLSSFHQAPGCDPVPASEPVRHLYRLKRFSLHSENAWEEREEGRHRQRAGARSGDEAAEAREGGQSSRGEPSGEEEEASELAEGRKRSAAVEYGQGSSVFRSSPFASLLLHCFSCPSCETSPLSLSLCRGQHAGPCPAAASFSRPASRETSACIETRNGTDAYSPAKPRDAAKQAGSPLALDASADDDKERSKRESGEESARDSDRPTLTAGDYQRGFYGVACPFSHVLLMVDDCVWLYAPPAPSAADMPETKTLREREFAGGRRPSAVSRASCLADAVRLLDASRSLLLVSPRLHFGLAFSQPADSLLLLPAARFVSATAAARSSARQRIPAAASAAAGGDPRRRAKDADEAKGGDESHGKEPRAGGDEALADSDDALQKAQGAGDETELSGVDGRVGNGEERGDSGVLEEGGNEMRGAEDAGEGFSEGRSTREKAPGRASLARQGSAFPYEEGHDLREDSSFFLAVERQRCEGDFAMALDLSCSLYRSEDLLLLFQTLQRVEPAALTHPNRLEVAGNRHFTKCKAPNARASHSDLHPSIAFPLAPACVVLTVNRVQELYANPVYRSSRSRRQRQTGNLRGGESPRRGEGNAKSRDTPQMRSEDGEQEAKDAVRADDARGEEREKRDAMKQSTSVPARREPEQKAHDGECESVCARTANGGSPEALFRQRTEEAGLCGEPGEDSWSCEALDRYFRVGVDRWRRSQREREAALRRESPSALLSFSPSSLSLPLEDWFPFPLPTASFFPYDDLNCRLPCCHVPPSSPTPPCFSVASPCSPRAEPFTLSHGSFSPSSSYPVEFLPGAFVAPAAPPSPGSASPSAAPAASSPRPLPTVSWLIPVHNGEKTILAALRSAVCQTHCPPGFFDVVMVDDCSSDETVAQLLPFCREVWSAESEKAGCRRNGRSRVNASPSRAQGIKRGAEAQARTGGVQEDKRRERQRDDDDGELPLPDDQVHATDVRAEGRETPACRQKETVIRAELALPGVPEVPLTLVRLAKQRGVAGALRRGLMHCRGEFIARLDADDVAHPQRLITQISFMRKHPQVAVCGSAFATFRWRLIFECPVAHPTVMLRRDALRLLPRATEQAPPSSLASSSPGPSPPPSRSAVALHLAPRSNSQIDAACVQAVDGRLEEGKAERKGEDTTVTQGEAHACVADSCECARPTEENKKGDITDEENEARVWEYIYPDEEAEDLWLWLSLPLHLHITNLPHILTFLRRDPSRKSERALLPMRRSAQLAVCAWLRRTLRQPAARCCPSRERDSRKPLRPAPRGEAASARRGRSKLRASAMPARAARLRRTESMRACARKKKEGGSGGLQIATKRRQRTQRLHGRATLTQGTERRRAVVVWAMGRTRQALNARRSPRKLQRERRKKRDRGSGTQTHFESPNWVSTAACSPTSLPVSVAIGRPPPPRRGRLRSRFSRRLKLSSVGLRSAFHRPLPEATKRPWVARKAVLAPRENEAGLEVGLK